MNRSASAILGVLLSISVWATDARPADVAGPFRAEELAAGVTLFRPAEGRTDLTNSLVVTREDGLLVVDAQPTPAAARLLLDAIAAHSEAPIRYLVLSHAHAEAAGGASAFPDSTLVIATRRAWEFLRDPSFDFGAEARERAGSAWREPPRRLPVLLLHARTELEDGLNEVEFLPLGEAHSHSDLLIQLPDRRIIYAGALAFVDRNPYVGAGSVSGWLGALNHLSKLDPALVVPLHGAPIDARGVRTLRDTLGWVRGQVEIGFIDQLPPDRIAERVLASAEIDRHFDMKTAPVFARGLVQAAVDEALDQRRKRGLVD